jgi:hypothetical protein
MSASKNRSKKGNSTKVIVLGGLAVGSLLLWQYAKDNTAIQGVKKYKPSSDADDLQPQYLFSLTRDELLVAIVKGLIDPVKLAENELENRGKDKNGRWVGFKKR